MIALHGALAFTFAAGGLAAASSLVDEIPAGTDVALRLELGRLKDAASVWEELAPLRKLTSGGPVLEVVAQWDELRAALAAAGGEVTAKDAQLTVLFDLDVKGGQVWAALLRPAGKAPREPPGEAVQIEGVAARLDREKNLGFARVGDALLVGNERGLQRQLRRLLGRDKRNVEPIVRLAQQLRTRSPVLVVLRPPDKALRQWLRPLGDLGALLGKTAGASLTAGTDAATLRLEGASPKEQKGLLQAGRVIAAGLPLRLGELLEQEELATGLENVGRPKKGAGRLEPEARKKLLEGWLRRAKVQATARARDTAAVELELTYGEPRVLLAALLLWGSDGGGERPGQLAKAGRSLTKVDPGTAERSLLALRALEQAYKRVRGEFVACGPVPRQVPKGEPVAWPRGNCFDALSFRPGAEVRFQWQVQLVGGRLALVARADPDGDGIPLVWFLGEEGVVKGAGIGSEAASGATGPEAVLPPESDDPDSEGETDDDEGGGEIDLDFEEQGDE